MLRDVLALVPEGEDPLPWLERVWALHPKAARWTPVKEWGLDPNDYREGSGYQTTIVLL